MSTGGLWDFGLQAGIEKLARLAGECFSVAPVATPSTLAWGREKPLVWRVQGPRAPPRVASVPEAPQRPSVKTMAATAMTGNGEPREGRDRDAWRSAQSAGIATHAQHEAHRRFSVSASPIGRVGIVARALCIASAAGPVPVGTQAPLCVHGFTNLRVIHSLSPMASYLACSLSPFVYVGGRAQTPPS